MPFSVVRTWVDRYFSDPQAILLAVLLAVGFGVVLTFGTMLAPVLAAIVIAYLMEGLVRIAVRHGAQRRRVAILVYLVFMGFFLLLVVGLTPLLWVQTVGLARELPFYLGKGQEVLLRLPDSYPVISPLQIDELILAIRAKLGEVGQWMLAASLSSIPGIITMLVYLILVPLLVFFFLIDKERILLWFTGLLPREHALASQVWADVNQQIGNYVLGKFWEIVIVGVATFVAFAAMGLKYAMLLSVLNGLSVVVPYVGAAVVTVPIAVVAYFQFGWTTDFAWLMAVYGIIQAVDGNILVPLLFSEVVNLHPVAIIVAVLVFGGLWGFWGVFFAIPLATLVSAILTSWPRPQ